VLQEKDRQDLRRHLQVVREREATMSRHELQRTRTTQGCLSSLSPGEPKEDSFGMPSFTDFNTGVAPVKSGLTGFSVRDSGSESTTKAAAGGSGEAKEIKLEVAQPGVDAARASAVVLEAQMKVWDNDFLLQRIASNASKLPQPQDLASPAHPVEARDLEKMPEMTPGDRPNPLIAESVRKAETNILSQFAEAEQQVYLSVCQSVCLSVSLPLSLSLCLFLSPSLSLLLWCRNSDSLFG